MWRVTFVNFWEECDALAHDNLFLTVDVFCHSLPEKRHILATPVQIFLNGKKCENSAGTGLCCSLPVSDLSLISEAWSGKAIWAKTNPDTTQPNFRTSHSVTVYILWQMLLHTGIYTTLGFSNHYPPHLRRVWLAPSPTRLFFTLLANSGNLLDISILFLI